ncbi:MAG: pyridoxamine 5'-phosphate oxidase [Desulfobulbaceae bacterium]|jgi:pyridoxamine 5'-phosphate oxidase|nr:pyridoxamine 5'-phosphate oxidase [Desulfobulbaceae bacterium]
MDVSALRREYLRDGLSRADLDPKPMAQFNHWFAIARQTPMPDPTAMQLATVDGDGQPSLRTILLKYFDDDGFVFFTNYDSDKAKDIAKNPKVCLSFPWLELERQVHVRGRAAKISAIESAKYFLSRPKDSQLAAWVSSQSHPLSSRGLLMRQFQEMKEKIGHGQVPVPAFWGGYRVRPESVEFWQGRENRLHDRFLYQRDGQGWRIERLAP